MKEGLSKRDFLKAAAGLGATALGVTQAPGAEKNLGAPKPGELEKEAETLQSLQDQLAESKNEADTARLADAIGKQIEKMDALVKRVKSSLPAGNK